MDRLPDTHAHTLGDGVLVDVQDMINVKMVPIIMALNMVKLVFIVYNIIILSFCGKFRHGSW